MKRTVTHLACIAFGAMTLVTGVLGWNDARGEVSCVNVCKECVGYYNAVTTTSAICAQYSINTCWPGLRVTGTTAGGDCQDSGAANQYWTPDYCKYTCTWADGTSPPNSFNEMGDYTPGTNNGPYNINVWKCKSGS